MLLMSLVDHFIHRRVSFVRARERREWGARERPLSISYPVAHTLACQIRISLTCDFYGLQYKIESLKTLTLISASFKVAQNSNIYFREKPGL